MNLIELEIFGKVYKLKSDKPQDEFSKIINKFEEKIRETKKKGDLDSPKDILVLTLLNMIEENLELKDKLLEIKNDKD
ncbi:MAG TPA: cell division protein ZapA [Candidatus Mcinerneyibacterium sp.]|nr:cell division protein ZapA [Candidatus Mcinerneyibacterium sp.]